ncbi:MAG: putative PEP-binding protein [Nitratireductor sp.]
MPLTLCGEIAGKPLAMALFGIGFRAVSMAPSAIGPVKAAVRQLDLWQAQFHPAARIGTWPVSDGTIRELLMRLPRKMASSISEAPLGPNCAASHQNCETE